jgi:hypothetical protein
MLERRIVTFTFRSAPPTGALGRTLYGRRMPPARQA